LAILLSHELAQKRAAFKHHLTDAHLKGIGSVAVRAGMLDVFIESSVEKAAIHLPKILREKASAFSTPQKIDLLGQLLTERMPADAKEIRELISRVHATRSERDDVIHRLWAATEDPNIKALWAQKDGKKIVKRRVTEQYLVGLAERLTDLIFEISAWKMKKLPEPFPLPLARLGKLPAKQPD
jgi:hypothetical protein